MSIGWKTFSIIFLLCLILFFIANFGKVFSLESEILFNKINSILDRVSPFRAALAPIQESADPFPQNEISEDIPEITVPEIINDIAKEETQNLPVGPNIQDQIDDIYEKLDILAQEVEELRAQELEQARLEDEAKQEVKDAEKEKQQEKEEEQKPEKKKQEDPPKINQTHHSSSSAPSPADLQPEQKILIVAVQTEGEKSSHDFIEIYNPNTNNIYLKNYRLVKRAKTSKSDTTIKSWARDSEVAIPAMGYYLWASNEDGYDNKIFADIATSQTLADDNGIAIRFGSEDTGDIMDALGWGDFNNVLFEGALPLPPNLSKNKSLERKKNAEGNFIDTDNNQQDFITQNNPRTRNSQNQVTIFDPVPTDTILETSSLPENQTILTDASFVFSANKDNSIFQCSIDESPFELCVSPKNYSELAVGEHKFQAFATDSNDIADETPAEYSWGIIAPPVEEEQSEENQPEATSKISHLLITEVQIDGNKSSYDFIELYNPTDSDIFLKDYKLIKRTKSAEEDTSIKSWAHESDAKILAKDYYLWASSKEDDNFPESVKANTKTTQYLANDNGVALKYNLEDNQEIVDALGWGDFSNELLETVAFIPQSKKNQSMERKKDSEGNYIDTDDNSQDFFLGESPNPKGQPLDLLGPVCQINFSNQSEDSLNFTVNWQSSDADAASYEIKMKIGEDGTWNNWIENTAEIQKDYTAPESNKYYFKCRATDKVSNEGDWSSDNFIEINQGKDPLDNETQP